MSAERVTDRVEGDTRRWLDVLLSHTESLLLHVAEHEAVASLDESLDSSCTTSESLYGDRPSTDNT